MRIINSVLSEQLYRQCIQDLEKLLATNCWVSSTFAWQEKVTRGVNGNCISTKTPPDLHEKIEKEIKQYLPTYSRITSCFYVWEKNSGICFHGDEKYLFDATVYLNEDWSPDFGGGLVWEVDETKSTGVYHCLFPKKGTIAINDSGSKHKVSIVSPNAPVSRKTIQIRGY
jgi:hypothetical protein